MFTILHELTKRDLRGRYKGSTLGLAWSFALPLVMLCVYSIVFGYIFPSRWTRDGETSAAFPLYLFAGMLPYMYTSETLNRATSIIRENSYLVKKVAFPLHLAVISQSLASAVHMLAGLGILATTALIANPSLPGVAFALAAPIALLPLFIFVTATALILSSLAVFIRDVAQLVSAALPALMFLSPVFYPQDSVPEPLRGLMALNPLTPSIEWLRDTILRKQFPDPATYVLYLALSLLAFLLATAWFNRLQPGFADKL